MAYYAGVSDGVGGLTLCLYRIEYRRKKVNSKRIEPIVSIAEFVHIGIRWKCEMCMDILDILGIVLINIGWVTFVNFS